MISVIIPVYKTEKYLQKCINSVLAQTYSELDVVLVDDGSPDKSGEICDEYAKKDKRVRAFHTENRGAAAARNLGLDKAREKKPEYIGFIDSDDWIEPGMYETLMRTLLETNADIVACCVNMEHTGDSLQKEKDKPLQGEECLKRTVYNGEETIGAFLEGKISVLAVDKLYKTELFDNVSFPEGKTYEDLATTYKPIHKAGRTAVIWESLYHYVLRPGSVSHSYSMKDLTDYWDACRSKYAYFVKCYDKKYNRLLLTECAQAISKVWRWAYINPADERAGYSQVLHEMVCFTKKNYPVLGFAEWPLWLKISMFFAHSDSGISFASANLIIRLYRKFFPNKYV